MEADFLALWKAVAVPRVPEVPRALRLVRWILAGQSVVLALASAFGFLYASLAIITGLQWILFSLACVGIALGLFAIAVFIAWLRVHTGRNLDRWTVLTGLTELVLFPAGVVLIVLATNYQPGSPGSPGTDGPFADGGYGAVALLGDALALGPLLIGALFGWRVCQVWLRLSGLRVGQPRKYGS